MHVTKKIKPQKIQKFLPIQKPQQNQPLTHLTIHPQRLWEFTSKTQHKYGRESIHYEMLTKNSLKSKFIHTLDIMKAKTGNRSTHDLPISHTSRIYGWNH